MNQQTNSTQAQPGASPQPIKARWQGIVARYQQPSIARASWQIVNSLVLYVVVWYLLCLSVNVSYWLTASLVVLGAGLLLRIFIIQHDCGHGSFFKSRRANDLFGSFAGVLTLTPYHLWRWEHSVHHATSGDLDRRGVGDVFTWTVSEYMAARRRHRILYRLFRNPLVMFVLLPPLVFVVRQRFTFTRAAKRERRSVHWTNLGILAVGVGMSALVGWKTYVLLQLAVSTTAACVGVWLFFVQHQFETPYWQRHDEWDYATAALQGSSFYKLSRVLQWFSGNIGFHHIHHLSPGIPNYNLERCQNADPLFQVPPLTFLASLKAVRFKLYDECLGRMVSFAEAARSRR